MERDGGAARPAFVDLRAFVVHGKVVDDNRVRYVLEPGAQLAGAAFLVLALVLGLATLSLVLGPIVVAAFGAVALVLLHRRGVDVLVEEREIERWQSIVVRFGRERIAAASLAVTHRRLDAPWNGDPMPDALRNVADLYASDVLIAAKLGREEARGIAEEIAQLVGAPPPVVPPRERA